MLLVFLLHQHKSSVYHTNTKFDTSCIFSQNGPPQRVDALSRYGSGSIKYFFQRHGNDGLLSSETKPKVDNLAVANFRSYPLHCTAAIGGILALSIFFKDTTARYVQFDHRTRNSMITIRCLNRLRHAASIDLLIVFQ